MSSDAPIREAGLSATPLRDLKLAIAGTPLETIIATFQTELERAGITRLRPHFYLSTEWGVPFDTISIAIPFYLARVDLTQFQAIHGGLVEGVGPDDILRYLRHEMGHVVNYAYRLYDRDEWVRLFGPIAQPYEEEYRPKPFSREFVHHLPGWYAQKHPDEDWAETFAVWLTPGVNWRSAHAGWPKALAKLEYCDSTLRELRDREPLVTETDADEDVSDLGISLEEYYRSLAFAGSEPPPGLNDALVAIFSRSASAEQTPERRPASELIRSVEFELSAKVFQWTGHFPERTRWLLRQMADQTDSLRLSSENSRERETIVALTAFVTALAMNHVHTGTYS